jgi:hypothetical protein
MPQPQPKPAPRGIIRLAPAPTTAHRALARPPVMIQLSARLLPLLLVCCLAGTLAAAEAALSFIEAIEKAHGAAAWPKDRALQADFTIRFGDKGWEGTYTIDRAMSLVRLDLKDGTTLVFDGKEVWMAPADSKFSRPRFWIFTPPYFALLPFKLRDQGARLTPAEPKSIDGIAHDLARLTFMPGTGDAPDDWYLLYRDPKLGRLDATAYIVTYARDAAKAAAEPHLLRYLDFQTVVGVTLATRWQFFNWNEAQGQHGALLGEWTLANVKFVPVAPAAFQRPEGARAVPMDAPK